MSNRTVQIYGSGYGSVPATVTATVDGTQVFSGAVPTQSGPLPSLPDTEITRGEVLFTFEIPMEFQGNLLLTTEIANSTVLFTDILANYGNIFDKAVAPGGQYISTGPDGYIPIQGNSGYYREPVPVPSDPRSSVIIDGIPKSIPDPKPLGETGAWWFGILPESTMSSNVAVRAGKA
jgi:hypothetical protein